MGRRFFGSVIVAGLLMLGSLVPVSTAWATATATAATETSGSLDQATPVGSSSVRVRGWAFDAAPDVQPINVAVYVDTTGYVVAAEHQRPDVQAAFGLATGGYGFQSDVPLPAGTHRVCAYALNNRNNPLLGCQTVVRTGDPLAVVDTVELVRAGGTALFDIYISGWSFDPDSPGNPGGVALYYQGNFLNGDNSISSYQVRTEVSRPDVQAAYGLSTDAVGFRVRLGARFCTTFVRLYALNEAGAGTNPLFYNVRDILSDTARRGTDPGPAPTGFTLCPPR